ncbi:hypothetical protein N7463_001162 [Penicillium fimorum]|uniref:Uncharacterized protein n=1 Tax=Penicillium fimorum TaxID=1882269 RepID=A0A9X0CBT1_9EURO|nr:hypothetical protein N7463_001162 [Penicillium fimorum]
MFLVGNRPLQTKLGDMRHAENPDNRVPRTDRAGGKKRLLQILVPILIGSAPPLKQWSSDPEP